MILYIIKSTIVLFVLFAFYKLFLERENMHTIKRIYLLASVILALIIPFNKIEIPTSENIRSSEITNENQENILAIMPDTFQIGYSPIETFSEKHLINEDSSTSIFINNWLVFLLTAIYTLGFLFFLIRFTRNIRGIHSIIKYNSKIRTKKNTKVLLTEKVVPHSFLMFMFLNKPAYETQSIAPEILLHEQTHIDQKHTLDILFLEIIQIIFWFNPLFHLIKKSIKLNHEFLADQKVIGKSSFIYKYQNILLQFAGTNQQSITSNINYSLTKKRLKMMTKRTSKVKSITWVLALIPVVLGLVLFLSSKALIAQDIYIRIINKNEIIINDTIHVRPRNIGDEIKKIIADYSLKQKEKVVAIIEAPENMDMGFVIDLNEEIRKSGVNTRKYTPDQGIEKTNSTVQTKKNKTFNGASEKMLKEYQNFMIRSKQNGSISHPEYVRIIAIYQLMNTNQKASVKKYPEMPTNDLSKTLPKTPSKKAFDSWKNKEKYAVWVDKKHIDNEFLNNYTADEYTYFTVSKVHKNARSKKFPQPYQISLFTKKSFENTFLKYNVNKYNTLLNRYINERNSIFRNPEKNMDETRILYKQLEILYKKLTPQEKEKYNIIMAPPIPKFPIIPDSLHLGDQEPPPPPPPPASVQDVILHMGQVGTTFYYQNKKISHKEALKITKDNKDIRFSIKDLTKDKPIVNLYKNPSTIK